MTPTGPHYRPVRVLWLWWIRQTADAAASLRATALCLAGAGKAPDALKLLERADAIEADGPDAQTSQAWTQATAKAVYKDLAGVDIDDPETRAKLAAAGAALNRIERDRADAAAVADETKKAQLAKHHERRRRRGRRS